MLVLLFPQIASSIVLCTLMSAPVMYLTARMVLVQYTSSVNYSGIIETTRRDSAAVAMAGLVSKPCLATFLTTVYLYWYYYNYNTGTFILECFILYRKTMNAILKLNS